MDNYSQEEIHKALLLISSTISKCEKMQHKFAEGTSQHSLLRNRIKALQISKCLIEGDRGIEAYTEEDLKKALPPVISIINKTEKAQSKYDEGNIQFKRFTPIIQAMYICKALIEEEIMKRRQ